MALGSPEKGEIVQVGTNLLPVAIQFVLEDNRPPAVGVKPFARQTAVLDDSSPAGHQVKVPNQLNMGYAVTILSKEEAMALPPGDRPICFRIPSELYHAVYEAIGEASMCWEYPDKGGVFQTERAGEVALRLCHRIGDELDKHRAKT